MEFDEHKYRQMKKALRRYFGFVGWLLLIYMAIMNVAVTGVVFWDMIATLVNAISNGNSDPIGVMMDNLPTGDVGYLLAVAIGLLILLIWKKPDFWKREIFAKGRPMTVRSFGAVLCLFLGGQFVYQLIMTGVEMILNEFGLSVVAGMEAVSMDVDSFAFFLYGGILAPITEEILFRGLIQRRLLPYGKRFAILCSSVVFGIFHGNLLQAPFGFLVGLLLGYVACEYNIVWAMVLHMVNNLVLGDLLYRVGDMIDPMATELMVSGLLLLSGVAAVIILIRKRHQIRVYRLEDPIYRVYLRCFFAAPGNVILMAIMVITSLVAGIFSAGPAAAAMMPIIVQLCNGPLNAQSDWIAVAYAAAICAGSSLFMWSATAGFILSGKVNGAGIEEENGGKIPWGVAQYMKYGVLNYLIQLSIALAVMAIVL